MPSLAKHCYRNAPVLMKNLTCLQSTPAALQVAAKPAEAPRKIVDFTVAPKKMMMKLQQHANARAQAIRITQAQLLKPSKQEEF